MAKLTGSVEIPSYRDDNWREIEREEIKKVATKLREAAPNDPLAGEEIIFQVADGYARYLVKRSKPLELVHLCVGDGYQVPSAHIRGLTLADVRREVEWVRKLDKVFSKTA